MTVDWSMEEFKEDLPNWSDNYTVTVTMKDEEPGTIGSKMVKGSDGYEQQYHLQVDSATIPPFLGTVCDERDTKQPHE